MATTTLFLVLGAAAMAAGLGQWQDLRVHSNGDAQFMRQLPRTLNAANALGWVAPPEESRESASCQVPYTTLCPTNDVSICLLFDEFGSVAGIEFGIVKANAASAYPFGSRSVFTSKKRFGYPAYIAQVFLIDQDTLNAGGRSSLTETALGLWVQTGRVSRLAVPRLEADTSAANFIKQTCTPGQGINYQFNVTSSTACSDTLPIVGIYNQGELVGFAFQSFGTVTPQGAKYFETLSTVSYKQTLLSTASPTCLSDWAGSYGLVSIHVFFTATPWLACC